MASKRKPFTFYDTFNDTFDSSVQALKNLSSFPTFSTSVPVMSPNELLTALPPVIYERLAPHFQKVIIQRPLVSWVWIARRSTEDWLTRTASSTTSGVVETTPEPSIPD